MKHAALIFCLMVWRISLTAQTNDTTAISDSTIRPALYSRHGDLLRDDPLCNRKAPLWQPVARLASVNVFNWALNRYFFKVDWTSSGIDDWKHNFKYGPEWDRDGFGTNFIGHPHTGTYYFNVARSNGYSFWESLPFTAGSSLAWEYLGENERPSYNDLIMTTMGGMQIGEVFYRVTSNILDDRTRGADRVWREMLTALINPTRSFNRLTSGKMFRVTNREVYEKAPMTLFLSTGAHRANLAGEEGNHFGSGKTHAYANIRIDYGDLFDPAKKNPFDFFRFRVEMRAGKGEKKLSIVEGYGLLAGKAIRQEKVFGGLFQHFDYWRSHSFELGSVGYGGSLITDINTGRRSGLYSTYHVSLVPLAAYHVVDNFDTNPVRTYNFAGGMQGKMEQEFRVDKRLQLGFRSYFYWLGVYKGLPGSGFFQIFKPYVNINLTRNIRIGFEHQIYDDNRYLRAGRNFHRTKTDQRLYLQFNLQDQAWRK